LVAKLTVRLLKKIRRNKQIKQRKESKSGLKKLRHLQIYPLKEETAETTTKKTKMLANQAVILDKNLKKAIIVQEPAVQKMKMRMQN